jgi:UDPglucose 6-dehydrogenase
VLPTSPTKCDVSDTSASSDCGSDGSITVAARQPNLVFSTEVAQCVSEADVVLIAVNTPTKSRGNGAGSATDMAAFEAVTAMVAQHATPGTIIVEKSTVPCRTAQLVQDTVRQPEICERQLSDLGLACALPAGRPL